VAGAGGHEPKEQACMCGVVGLFHPIDPTPPAVAVLRRMADAIAHRGPDGDGFHVEPHVGLGHRRLAIVDLAGGVQPMATPDGQVVVSFNGEIFNHLELRAELEKEGHVFRTRSDTEAILHGWRQWGPAVAERLSGQFAFAIWDRGRGTLFLARDRLGEKPMHLAWLPDGALAFASELAALLTLPEVSRTLDPAALEDVLALGYIPDPATIYAGIRRLPPAHTLLLRRGETGRPEPRRYWSPPTRTLPAPDRPAEALEALLDRAVRAQLMSDVPLGCFLSAGLDSGIVTALAARARREAGGAPMATFTIGFPGAADEREGAAQVAARHGTLHHAEADIADYLGTARDQAGIFGEPFADSSSVPTLAVCRLARRHATVALSGDGGDEVFAGYRRYRFHLLAEAARRLLPDGLRRRVVGSLARAYPKLDRAPKWLRAKTTLTEISLDSAEGYYRTNCKFADERRRAVFSPGLRTALDGHDPSARFASLMAACDPEDSLLQAQYADLLTYLPGDILVKTDRTSMAVSLEVRPPILDPKVVEWGLALPAGLKLPGRGGSQVLHQGKQVLREAAAPFLPPALVGRPKTGFGVSLADQLRAGAHTLRTRLLAGPMQDSGLFDRPALARLIDEHEAGSFDHAQKLWSLVMVEGFLANQAQLQPAGVVARAA
jgi:asparagine synthase (glutamine-hydrolysing)